MKNYYRPRALTTVVALVLMLFASGATAANITVVNNDSGGEGFNDPTPATPVGGNPGNTLGAQRLNAFQYAADIWGIYLISGVTILVQAQMDPLTCTPTAAILGAAGTTTIHRNFGGAPLPGTYYSQALANSLNGSDLVPGTPDINATFNSNLNGNPGCLNGRKWYYGYDQNPPGNDIDFVSVLLHEIGHGLGFQTFVNLASGAKFNGSNDTYMLNLERVGASPSAYSFMNDAQRVSASQSDPNLRWIGTIANAEAAAIPVTAGLNGGLIRVHAPSPQQPGSSVSHWTPDTVPNELMEPAYTGPNHWPSMAIYLMGDLGWQLSGNVAVTIAAFNASTANHGVELRAVFHSDNGRVRNVNIYRADGLDGVFGLLESIASVGDDFAFTDQTAEPGHTYRYRLGVVDRDGEFFSQSQLVQVPQWVAALQQNFPNPFNPSTSIKYRISENADVTLAIYDVSGRLVQTLERGTRTPGQYEARWDGRDTAGNAVASGLYFYRLEAGRFAQTKRMVLLR